MLNLQKLVEYLMFTQDSTFLYTSRTKFSLKGFKIARHLPLAPHPLQLLLQHFQEQRMGSQKGIYLLSF